MVVKFYTATNFAPLTQRGVRAVHVQSRAYLKDSCYDNPKASEQIFIVLATTKKVNHVVSGC